MNPWMWGAAIINLAAVAPAQSVVINKFLNGTPDVVEVLVVTNGLDMRGMIIKDYSSSGANDNGGKYTFSTDTLWSAVKSGTLIVLRNNNSAADVSAGSGDFLIDVGLQNATYFVSGGGTFDIATSEIVMVKSAGSGINGSTGAIHTFASGTAGAAVGFTGAPTPKVATSTGDTGTGEVASATNSTGTLADFNGTDALGNELAASYTFGTPHNANNTAYRNTLIAAAPVSITAFSVE